MLRLELKAAKATLEVLTTRTEKNGQDDVPASTLKFSVPRTAEVLDFFGPTLKGDIFDFNGPKDLASGVSIKNAHLNWPQGTDQEMTGAEVSVSFGIGEPMKLADCQAKGFKWTPHDGGIVILEFSVNCKPDAWKDIPRLYLQQKREVDISLTPAELPTMGGDE